MKTEVKTITPAKAKEMLKHNVMNRSVRDNTVTKYASAMKRDQWVMNGEAICFDNEGNLLDGQHRLLAVIKADKPIQFLIVRGIEKHAFSTYNQGKTRSASDVLGIAGYKYTAGVAAAVRIYLHYKNKSTQDLTNDDVLEFIYSNPSFYEFCTDHFSLVHNSDNVIRPSMLIGLGYEMHKKHPNKWPLFFEACVFGVGLRQGDPVYVLRRKVQRAKEMKMSITKTNLGGMLVRAWNYHVEGASIVSIKSADLSKSIIK